MKRFLQTMLVLSFCFFSFSSKAQLPTGNEQTNDFVVVNTFKEEYITSQSFTLEPNYVFPMKSIRKERTFGGHIINATLKGLLIGGTTGALVGGVFSGYYRNSTEQGLLIGSISGASFGLVYGLNRGCYRTNQKPSIKGLVVGADLGILFALWSGGRENYIDFLVCTATGYGIGLLRERRMNKRYH